MWYDEEALSKGFPDIYQESTLKAMMVNDMEKWREGSWDWGDYGIGCESEDGVLVRCREVQTML